MVVSDELPNRLKGSLEREGEKVNFFFENLSLLPETSAAKEHFKLVFGSGNSDLAKIRPLKNWHSPDFLSGFALWLMGFCLGAGPVCVYSAISNMSWTKKSSLRLSLVLMLLCAALYMIDPRF